MSLLNKLVPGLAVTFLIIVVGLFGYAHIFNSQPDGQLNALSQTMTEHTDQWLQQEKDVGQFYQDLQQKRVKTVGLMADEILVTPTAGGKYYVRLPGDSRIEQDLQSWAKAGGTLIAVGDQAKPDGFSLTLDRVMSSVYILSLLGLVVFAIHAIYHKDNKEGEEGSGKAVTTVGNSTTNRFQLVMKPSTSFSEVIGAKDAKEALRDVVLSLKEPERFSRLGAKPPKGVLLEGPPGTGKTLLARALAGEAGANFISATGSDFSAKYYGEGISRVKALFELAQNNKPCIIFIDEIEGLGTRGRADTGGRSEENRIINTFLAIMDGFSPLEGVIVVAATNNASHIDPALIRDGRFDRRCTVSLPSLEEREALFDYYGKKITLSPNVDLSSLARRAIGMSPATIATTINQAATLAAKENAASVADEHLFRAIDIQHMGGLPGNSIANEAERKRVAVHEAGHAIIARLLKTGLVEKVTILPHGRARGITLVTQEEEQNILTRTDLLNQIEMLLAGRAAEILVMGDASSGAQNDLARASEIAFNMVSELGLGEKMDPFSVAHLRNEQMGDSVRAQMVEEGRAMVADAAERALGHLTEHRPALERVARALVEKETIDAMEFSILAA